MTSPRLPTTGAERFWPGARRNEVPVETPAQKRARTFHKLMEPTAGDIPEFEQFDLDPAQLPPELTSQYMEGPLGDIAGPFVPEGAAAGQLWQPGLTGFIGGGESAARVPWEMIEDFPPGMYEEYAGPFGPEPWAGLRPSPGADVTAAQLSEREFEWSLLSPQEKSKATIARLGQGMFGPGDLPIAPFMPGVEPKPRFGTKDDLIDPERAMAALMKGIEAATRPLDAFSEAGWQTLSSDLRKGEFDVALFDLLTHPDKFVDVESEYIKAFRERPLLQQFAVSLVDPFLLVGPARQGSKLAMDLLRTLLRRETGQFAGRFATGTIDDFIRLMREPKIPSVTGRTGPLTFAPPGRMGRPEVGYVDATWEQWARPGVPGPGNVRGPVVRPTIDEFLEAYDPFYPSEPVVPRPLRLYRQDLESQLATLQQRITDVETRKGPRMAGGARKALLARLRNEQQLLEDQLSKLDIPIEPVDIVESMRHQNYRQVDALPGNQQQIIVVSMAYTGGRRVTLILNRDTRRLLTELGQISPEDADYIILERSATRGQVRDAAATLTNKWAKTGRGIGLAAEESWKAFVEPDIPPGLIIRDEPAFPVSNLSATESRRLLSHYLADFPHEVQNLDELGSQLPTDRVIEGAVRLERISPPTHMPEYFEGHDIFGVIEDTIEGPETVAVIEMLKPKGGSMGQIVHFYPTVSGGGPGMLRGEPMKKILSDLAAFYPHLHDIEMAGRPIYHKNRVITSADFDDAAYLSIGDTTVTDDIADGISDSVPGPTRADPDIGPTTTDGAPQNNAVSVPGDDGMPRTGADLYKEAQAAGMLTPEERAGMINPDETPDPANPFYVMKTWLSHNKLFGPESRGKWLRGRPGTRVAGAFRKFAGLWNRVAMERDSRIAMLGHSNQLHKDIEFARIKSIVTAWWKQTQDAFGFREQDLNLLQRAAGTIRGTWRATKVQFTDGGNLATKVKNYRLSGTLDDILEDIDRVKEGHAPMYALTFEQQRLLDAGQQMQEQLLLVARDAGVDVVGIEEAYWHRILYKKNKWEVDDLVRTQFKGTQMGYTNRRGIEHMNQAEKLGLVYETHPALRLIARLQAGVETIANTHTRKEILNLTDIDVGLPNATGRKLFAPAKFRRLLSGHPEILESLKETNAIRKEAGTAYKAHIRATEAADAAISYDPNVLLALRKAEADYVTALHKALMTGQIVRGISKAALKEAFILGKSGPEDVVKSILNLVHIPEIQNSRPPGLFGGVGARWTREATQLARSMMTNVDLAVSYIQGNTIFFYRPKVWLRATMESWAAFVREPRAYYEKNWTVMDEGMNNAAIMRPTEFLFEQTGLASYPTKIPFLGDVLTRFNRSFEWYIVAAQTEMYKVARKSIVAPADTPFGAFINNQESRDALVDLGKAIRRTLGTENYAILGIRSDQQTIEALTLFAARFFRANLGLVGMALNPLDTTSQGAWRARAALTRLMAAGLGITTAIHYAKTGRPPNVTDPYAVDWLQFPVGKGYMNTFGPFYSYMRTVARMGDAFAQGEAGKAMNEAKMFLQSRAGLPFRTMGITADVLANPAGARTFEGERIEATPRGVVAAAGEVAIPIAPSEIFRGLSDGRWEVTAEIMGLITRANPYQQLDLLYQNYHQDPTNDMALMREEVRPKEDDYPVSITRRDLSWKEGLAKALPDLLSGDIWDRAHGPSWADAMPAEREWMQDEHPDLYEAAITSRPGDYGEASREMWEDHKAMIVKERLLNKALYNPEQAANDNVVDGSEYRRRFNILRLQKWTKRQEVNERYDLFQDVQKPEDEKDPNKRAMMEYHLVYGRNTRGDGSMNWVEVEREMDELAASWTQTQKKYVDINTSRWHTEKGDELIRDKRALRELWDLRDTWITDFSDTPAIQAEYERMYEEYSNASDTYKNQMSQLPSYRNMLRVLALRENQWIEDHNTKEHGYKGGTLEVLKVKWGYETDPITPQGIALLEEYNELMLNLDVPRLRPVLPTGQTSPSTLGGPGQTQDLNPFRGGPEQEQDANPFRVLQAQGPVKTGNPFSQTP